MKNFQAIISGFLGGISIGIGCFAYAFMLEKSALIAAVLFATGFLAAAIFDFGLFTDKSGYILTEGKLGKKIAKIFLTFVGNLLGVILIGLILTTQIQPVSLALLKATLSYTYFEIFINSLVCGILLFVGMHGYRKAGGFTSYMILACSTAIIALCGFDYALLNVFTVASGIGSYSTLISNMFKIIMLTLINFFGNAAGAIIFATLCKYKEAETKHHHSRHSHHGHKHHRSSHTKESEKTESKTDENK